MKTCRKCGEVKPCDAYSTIKPSGNLRGTCNKCRSAGVMATRDPELKKATDDRYRLSHRQMLSDKARFRRRGITAAEYDNLLALQHFSCAICGTTDPKGKGRFHIDHCHETGVNRGLLCANCNLGLGHFRDNKDLLHTAINYPSNHGK